MPLRWSLVEPGNVLCYKRGAPRGAFRGMNAPNLQALQRGEAEAWDEAFRWLWPTAFAVAKLKLQPFLPQDIEDVTIEAVVRVVRPSRGGDASFGPMEGKIL